MDAVTTAPRERRWGLVVLALLASLAVAAAPVWPGAAGLAAAVARLAVPVEQTLLLVIPALAACAVVAWWHGGSAWLAVVWLAFAGWTIAQPFAPGAASAAGGGYPSLARGWNFGASDTDSAPVASIADRLARLWGARVAWKQQPGDHTAEPAALRLDSSAARSRLGWAPRLTLDLALARTVEWYRAEHDGGDVAALTLRQINNYLR